MIDSVYLFNLYVRQLDVRKVRNHKDECSRELSLSYSHDDVACRGNIVISRRLTSLSAPNEYYPKIQFLSL